MVHVDDILAKIKAEGLHETFWSLFDKSLENVVTTQEYKRMLSQFPSPIRHAIEYDGYEINISWAHWGGPRFFTIVVLTDMMDKQLRYEFWDFQERCSQQYRTFQREVEALLWKTLTQQPDYMIFHKALMTHDHSIYDRPLYAEILNRIRQADRLVETSDLGGCSVISLLQYQHLTESDKEDVLCNPYDVLLRTLKEGIILIEEHRGHQHDWDPETDYCTICGADGRA